VLAQHRLRERVLCGWGLLQQRVHR
jgi:hypothetical protein